MLRTIGLLTVVYFVLLACGVNPHGLVKKAVRAVDHALMTPTERQVAKVAEPVAETIDAAKSKINSVSKGSE